ncbi:type-F conjugative transfer system pilin assembly protein TrbC [Vibrio genomosp. F6]|jgi:conjugal transfer pilus assembly protein TrbC|nr:type-F conjugative transfer system pilin assembly protein TrbC [Vibrio genomosp. F6]
MNPFYMKEKTLTSLLWGLMLLVSTQSQAYTRDELRAFSALENKMIQQAPPPSMDFSEVEAKANAHRQQTLEASQKIQALVKGKHLSPLLDIPKPTQNPDQAPKGVMVFVSLTLPETTLRQLLYQSEALKVPLVIRGVLPQGFAATTQRIGQLIGLKKKKPIMSGFSISPEWFRQFDIQRVPAFVSVKPGKCLPKQACGPHDFDIVYGNVSMYEALSVLREGDTGSEIDALLNHNKE